MEPASYPTTRYQPPPIPDYSSIATRRRLSGPSLRRFFKIMRKWKIGTKDARLLLGGIPSRRFKQLSSRPEGRILNQDQLLRVTSVIAIDQSVRQLIPRRQADKWALKPDRMLPGGTPLFNLIQGGALTLWRWRLFYETQAAKTREAGKRRGPQEYLDLCIEEMEFSVRTHNSLKDSDIQTVGELVECTEDDLLDAGLNEVSLNEIKDALDAVGLKLGRGPDHSQEDEDE
jgi:hypothetical protein